MVSNYSFTTNRIQYRLLVRIQFTLVVLATLLPTASLGAQDLGDEQLPSVVVLMKFEPGARRQWTQAFETYIVPAIQDAIRAGSAIVDFEYFENVVVGQHYDFVLILRTPSFDFFDDRRPFPHYEALYRRVGPEEGRRIVGEMSDMEQSISIILTRSFRWKR